MVVVRRRYTNRSYQLEKQADWRVGATSLNVNRIGVQSSSLVQSHFYGAQSGFGPVLELELMQDGIDMLFDR